MGLAPDPQGGLPTPRDGLERALELVDQCRDILFDYAPVMMHSIDESGRLVRVNRKWQTTLGYEPGEVLGRRSVDFLTEESQAWAVEATLPLFWQNGRAHSIGYEMVRKNGRILNVLLDAVTVTTDQGSRVALATLRDNYDSWLWREASMILGILVQLAEVRQRLIEILTAVTADVRAQPPPGGEGPVGQDSGGRPLKESLDELLALCQDVSTKLGDLREIQDTWVHTLVNQQQELLLLASPLDLAFDDLGVAVTQVRLTLE